MSIDWRTEWKTGIHAKFVILLKYRNYYYYYYYFIDFYGNSLFDANSTGLNQTVLWH